MGIDFATEKQFPTTHDPAVETPAGVPGTHGEHIQLMHNLPVLLAGRAAAH